jgi:hypothetical protein
MLPTIVMGRKSSKRKRQAGRPIGAAGVLSRALVVVDEGPIRASAVKVCRKAMRDLEKARKKLEDFERLDQPAFTRWYHATFGADLSRSRDLKEKTEEMELLIDEIESVRIKHSVSYHSAYEHVMDGRKHPERYERKREGPRHRGTKKEEEGPAAEAPPRQNRTKGLYRALVKRLHPDLRPRDDAYRYELWHRVQAAYAQEDVEGLETLTALCDIRIDNSFAVGSVSSILAVGLDQREQLAAVKRRIRSARKEPAWGFGTNPAIADSLEPLIRQELESGLDVAQRLYEDCRDTLESWSIGRATASAGSYPRERFPR